MKIKTLHSSLLFIYVFLLHFEYWDFSGVFNENFSISKFTAITYIYIYIVRFKKILLPEKFIPYLKKIFCFYILFVLSSLLYSNKYSEITDVLNLSVLQNFILFWFISTHMIRNPDIILISLKAFLLGGITVSLLSAFGIGFVELEGRIYMFGEDPNYVGYRLVFTAIILLHFILHSKKTKLNILFWISTLLLLLKTITETGSRGATICFFILLLFLILKVKTKWYLRILITLTTLVVTYTMYLFIIDNEMMAQRIMLSLSEGDVANRNVIWNNLIKLYYINPLTGIGQTGFEIESINIFGKYYDPHNVYLEILIKTGLIGFLIYFTFVFKLFRESLSILKKTKIISPYLLMIATLFMFSNIQGMHSKTIYFCFSYVVASSIILKKIVLTNTGKLKNN